MLLEIAHPSGMFVHQLPSGGSSGALSSLVFTVIVIALLQLHTSICFGLFHQCRLIVCIVKSIQFLSVDNYQLTVSLSHANIPITYTANI